MADVKNAAMKDYTSPVNSYVYKDIESSIFSITSPTKGLRDDKNKLGIHMLPVLALEEIAKVFDYGKNKYSRDGYDATDNWRKGLSWRSTVGSLLRHSFAFLRGQDRDEESGLYHMAHVGANALFLLQFLITNGGTDDRYKESQTEYKEISDVREDDEIYKGNIQTRNKKDFYTDPIDF